MKHEKFQLARFWSDNRISPPDLTEILSPDTAPPAHPIAARRHASQTGPHVEILLALHNGGAWLGEQLDSFTRQNHANWSLTVSDDDSRDDGPVILRRFAQAHPDRRVTLLNGPKLGFAHNFLHLLRQSDRTAPFVALSDQDDVWLPEKLSLGLAALEKVAADTPAVYCGRTWISDEKLSVMRASPEFRRRPGFRNALVQNVGGGNTMMLNRAAVDLLAAASFRVETVVAHDWWIYQMISGTGGVVIYDPRPAVIYRQHDDNLIGASDTLRASLFRMVLLLRGRFRGWNATNIQALRLAVDRLTPENRALLEAFALARGGSLGDRVRFLRRSGLYRQTLKGNAGLWLAALFNRF